MESNHLSGAPEAPTMCPRKEVNSSCLSYSKGRPFQTFVKLTENQKRVVFIPYISFLRALILEASESKPTVSDSSEEQNIYPYPCVCQYTYVHIYASWRDCEAPQPTPYKTGEQTNLVMWLRSSSNRKDKASGENPGVSPKVWDPGSLILIGRKHGCLSSSRKSRFVLLF